MTRLPAALPSLPESIDKIRDALHQLDDEVADYAAGGWIDVGAVHTEIATMRSKLSTLHAHLVAEIEAARNRPHPAATSDGYQTTDDGDPCETDPPAPQQPAPQQPAQQRPSQTG